MDEILHISLEGGQARALVAVTTDLVEKARETHSCSVTASAALGRALTASVMMGVMMKNQDDRLTVTMNGGGPIGQVVCTAYANGTVKGYVDHPAIELPRKVNGKLDVGGAVGKNGHITVVRDLGLKEPYVGRTRMVSGEIAEDFAFYLTVSEQTPSLVSLGVMVEKGHVVGAGGVLIQPMPDCTEEVLEKLEALTAFLTGVSTMVHEVENADALAKKTLSSLEYDILNRSTPIYQCDCSREHIERVLLSMGETEIMDMINTQHGAQVSCHFCNKRYDFTENDLHRLIYEGKTPAKEE